MELFIQLEVYKNLDFKDLISHQALELIPNIDQDEFCQTLEHIFLLDLLNKVALSLKPYDDLYGRKPKVTQNHSSGGSDDNLEILERPK